MVIIKIILLLRRGGGVHANYYDIISYALDDIHPPRWPRLYNELYHRIIIDIKLSERISRGTCVRVAYKRLNIIKSRNTHPLTRFNRSVRKRKTNFRSS